LNSRSFCAVKSTILLDTADGDTPKAFAASITVSPYFLAETPRRIFFQQLLGEHSRRAQALVAFKRDFAGVKVTEPRVLGLHLLIADKYPTILVGPLLQPWIRRVVIRPGQLFAFHQHDALGHYAAHLQHHPVQRLLAVLDYTEHGAQHLLFAGYLLHSGHCVFTSSCVYSHLWLLFVYVSWIFPRGGPHFQISTEFS
jgi:hypothetical protein